MKSLHCFFHYTKIHFEMIKLGWRKWINLRILPFNFKLIQFGIFLSFQMANLENIDWNQLVHILQFRYSGKKIWKKISQVYQDFVAFSEYRNFTHPVGTLADSGFFKTFCIKVAWSLQFLGYLRTLSLKFQKATTKIGVFLTLPS